jgi:nucleoid-associated protein YgaU
MSRNVPFPPARSVATPAVAPSQDAIGSLMIRQRPDIIGQRGEHADPLAGDKVTDLGEIARILMGCLAQDKDEDDLVFELLMLESMLADTPLKSDELLAQLGALGDEVREGMLPPGMINVAALRQRTRRIRQHLGGLASRVSAALLMVLTGLPLAAQDAQAADEEGYAVASAPVVRVIDATTGQGMAGVQIKTMEERLLGVTDATGQATLADGYMETDLLSLEKDGYEMYLLDRSQLSSRNIVSMKSLGGAMAAAPAPGAHGAGAGHQPSAPRAAAPKPAAVAVKPPTPPKGAEAPRVAHGANGPHLVAPKAPTKPTAPTIRLPMKPKPAKAAEVHARAAAPAMVAHAPAAAHATPEIHVPARPEKPAGLRAAAPAAHAPALPTARHAAPSAAHEATMTLPAKPRRPMTAQGASHAAAPRETAHVAIPRRMPRPRYEADHQAASGYYRVRPGDSLSLIAQRTLGSARKWPQIYAANRDKLSNPRFIRAGQTLALPSTSNLARGGTSYVVKPGDCLFTIANAQLGQGTKWQSIWQMNRDKIRDARFIYPGQVLTLPTA